MLLILVVFVLVPGVYAINCTCNVSKEVHCTSQWPIQSLTQIETCEMENAVANKFFLHDSQITCIRNNAFKEYESTEELYINNNNITVIEEKTLDNMKNLRVLSFAKSNLKVIPLSILKLPKLESLDLSYNPDLFNNVDFNIPLSEHIEAPLRTLDVSGCDIHVFPNMGPLPNLRELKIANNNYLNMESIYFFQLRSIKIVDYRGINQYGSTCSCLEIIQFWRINDVQIIDDNQCPETPNRCFFIIHKLVFIVLGSALGVLLIVLCLPHQRWFLRLCTRFFSSHRQSIVPETQLVEMSNLVQNATVEMAYSDENDPPPSYEEATAHLRNNDNLSCQQVCDEFLVSTNTQNII